LKILFIVVLLAVVSLFGAYSFDLASKEKQKIIIGLSKIELNKEKTVGTQVDRVIRDVFPTWNNSSFSLRVPADRIPKNSSEIVPMAEGARVREMMNWAGVKVFP
jgi:hypothetical protein